MPPSGFENGSNSWWKLGGLGDLLFATLNVRYIYLENQVLNLLAFAEGYHRALH